MSVASLAEFGALYGKTKQAVAKWKAKGYLVMRGDKIDVAKSKATLLGRRIVPVESSTDRQPSKPVDAAAAATAETQGEPGAESPAAAATPTETPTTVNGNGHANGAPPIGAGDDPLVDIDTFMRRVQTGNYGTFAEAEKVKENALALKHLIEARLRAGEVIELAAVERRVFELSRSERDGWMNWPSRIGPLLAADLGLEADKVTEALNRYVHEHLAELGEPEANFNSLDQPG